jgi:type II secretory pathway pseudopilin PulG
MELVVVMAVLIALATIVVAVLPGMIGRAHTSSSATNLSELNKAIQLYEGTFFSYPNGWDRMTDASGTLCDYLPGASGTTAAGGVLSVSTPTAAEVAALDAAGINQVHDMVGSSSGAPAGWTPTHEPYLGAAGTFTAISTTTDLVYATELAVETMMRSDGGTADGDRYVVLGIGRRCSMVGRTIADPPTHFPDHADDAPHLVYQRFVAVFKVRNKGQAMPRALFVGTLALHEDGVSTADREVGEYFKLTGSSQ